MKYYQTFTVRTTLQFPIDMLRYDGCFPHTETDSGKITQSLSRLTKGACVVQIGRYVSTKRMNSPSIGRWESFGCAVSEVVTR